MRLFDYLNSMIDIAILFTNITAYEYEFDPTKDTTTRDILYIFLSAFTVLGFIVNWFGDKLNHDFEVEIKGALANTKPSTGERILSIIGKIRKCPRNVSHTDPPEHFAGRPQSEDRLCAGLVRGSRALRAERERLFDDEPVHGGLRAASVQLLQPLVLLHRRRQKVRGQTQLRP